jgi:ornithine cyclodeaminase/alanine dehydrogenase-like protein (mu-crystallin family)
MTRIFSNDDVERLLTMEDCLAAMEEGYGEIGAGRAAFRTSSNIVTPTVHEGGVYALKSMDGVIPSMGVSCIRLNSDILTWKTSGGSTRRVKKPAAPNNRWVGLVLLFSTHTGEPLAIFPDGVMQRMRVGATNGLAAKYMARPDAGTVAIIGSGWQAGAQLMAIAQVRKITDIRVFSPTPANRENFAREWSDRLGITVTAVGSVEAAVKGRDIVLCATSSLDTVFFRKHLEPGMHLSTVKGHEIEPAAVNACDIKAVHMHEPPVTIIRTHNVAIGEDKHASGVEFADEIDTKAMANLSDLVAGRGPTRARPEQTSVFLNANGLGAQFAMCGAALYKRAVAANAGHDLPTDWFTEDVHP